jgi:predicted MFS family arabinose efflux permease
MSTAPRAAEPVAVSERLIVFLVGAIQFVNIVDFMMVMPLGPDYARALGISTAHIGLIAGSYTAAAAIAGIVAARFLDRFDRRKALGVALFGLVTGTAAGALAQGLTTLVLARAIAGSFGGPATSIALSIIADVVPPMRRGRALGAVMGAFSVASVLGVPLGLRLATWGGWRLPFMVVAGMGLVVGLLALWRMPPLRGHIAAAAAAGTTGGPKLSVLLRDQTIRLALAMNGLVMLTAFLVVPTIAPHLLQNLGFPRDRLDLAYMVGGAASFLIMRIAGHGIDRYGAARVSVVGTALLIGVLYFAFIAPGAIGVGGVLVVFVV